MLTRDLNFFFFPDPTTKRGGEKINYGSCKIVNFLKGSENEIRDQEKLSRIRDPEKLLPYPDPGGQKSTRSWIRIRNIDPNIPTSPSSYHSANIVMYCLYR
jgi:hypothetical protein